MRRKFLLSASVLGFGLVLGACASGQARAEQEAIAVAANQLGFESGGYQALTLKSADSIPLGWNLRAADGSIVRSGVSRVFGVSEAAGDSVHTVTITPPISNEGSYQLQVDEKVSDVIKVIDDLYSDLSEKTLNYFYLNRAGLDILKAYAPSAEWAREAGHTTEYATCFSGKDKSGLEWPGCDYTLDVTGGWYDAGDYGKYAVNGGIAVWMLQNAAERLIAQGGMAENGWGDGRAMLPESNNGVPDILDEARWQIEFLLSLQVPDGKTLYLPKGDQTSTSSQGLKLTPVAASGLVHHKVHGTSWPAFPLRPKDDTSDRYLMPPSTAATLNMVAAAAQAARLWQGIDDEFAEECLRAAIKGYDAAKRHPDVFAYDNFDGGGAYGDFDVSDEFAWAAMELYATTGDASYISQLSHTPGALWLQRAANGALQDAFWGNVDLLPFLTTLTVENLFSDADKSRALSTILVSADRYVADASRDGYGVPFPADGYGWGSNGAIASRSLVLGNAYDATSDPKYRNAIVASLDYLLGRNPLNQSYIAGFGSNPVKYVHHRFWGAGADPAFPIAAPGALSGGPNADYPVGDTETAFVGACAPQKCWIDDHNGYSINEVAINWNAALFWSVSFLETSSQSSEPSTESTQ